MNALLKRVHGPSSDSAIRQIPQICPSWIDNHSLDDMVMWSPPWRCGGRGMRTGTSGTPVKFRVPPVTSPIWLCIKWYVVHVNVDCWSYVELDDICRNLYMYILGLMIVRRYPTPYTLLGISWRRLSNVQVIDLVSDLCHVDALFCPALRILLSAFTNFFCPFSVGFVKPRWWPVL